MEHDLKKGYVCGCGKYNRFTAWVYAHMNIKIRHTCECGRTNILLRGRVAETVEVVAAKGYDEAR